MKTQYVNIGEGSYIKLGIKKVEGFNILQMEYGDHTDTCCSTQVTFNNVHKECLLNLGQAIIDIGNKMK